VVYRITVSNAVSILKITFPKWETLGKSLTDLQCDFPCIITVIHITKVKYFIINVLNILLAKMFIPFLLTLFGTLLV